MPRCFNCRDKFVASRFLQKACDKSECLEAERQMILNKSKLKKLPIRKVSKKRRKQSKEYSKLRADFLLRPENRFCPVTNKQTIEVHHKNGRENQRLTDTSHWLAVSREGHQWIHNNPKEAREKGWLI